MLHIPLSPCSPRPAGSGFPSQQLSTVQKIAIQPSPLQLGPLRHRRQVNSSMPKAGVACRWRCQELLVAVLSALGPPGPGPPGTGQCTPLVTVGGSAAWLKVGMLA